MDQTGEAFADASQFVPVCAPVTSRRSRTLSRPVSCGRGPFD